MSKPNFKHDCNNCHFLGDYEYKGQNVDLYFHPSEDPVFKTVIYRFSSDGPDYGSGLDFAYNAQIKGELDSPYYVAMTRAIKEGYLKLEKLYMGNFNEETAQAKRQEIKNSDYFINRPLDIFDLEERGDIDTDTMSDQEYSDLDDKIDAEIEAYDNDYQKKHGNIPKVWEPLEIQIVSNVDEAKQKIDPETLKVISAVNEFHARRLYDAEIASDRIIQRSNVADLTP